MNARNLQHREAATHGSVSLECGGSTPLSFPDAPASPFFASTRGRLCQSEKESAVKPAQSKVAACLIAYD